MRCPKTAKAEVTYAATGGNPFLVGELVHEVKAAELSPRATSAARVAHLGPRGVADEILVRLPYLPASTPAEHGSECNASSRPSPRVLSHEELLGLG